MLRDISIYNEVYDAEGGKMSVIDSSNAKEHSYPVYGRQFKSYGWYKPLIVFILFLVIYLILGMALSAAVAYINYGGLPTLAELQTSKIFYSGYDDMDLSNTWQSVAGLGVIAVMIPALWLTTKPERFGSFLRLKNGIYS